MKIRGGFVSNSSSSSFVIGLPKDVKSHKLTVEEVAQLVFGTTEGCILAYDSPVSYIDAAEQILSQIKGQKAANNKKTINRVTGAASGYYYGGDLPKAPEWPDDVFDIKDPEQRWAKLDVHHKECDKAYVERAKLIVERFEAKGCKAFVVKFADEDGSFFCTLEHGGTFDKLKEKELAYVFSHH